MVRLRGRPPPPRTPPGPPPAAAPARPAARGRTAARGLRAARPPPCAPSRPAPPLRERRGGGAPPGLVGSPGELGARAAASGAPGRAGRGRGRRWAGGGGATARGRPVPSPPHCVWPGTGHRVRGSGCGGCPPAPQPGLLPPPAGGRKDFPGAPAPPPRRLRRPESAGRWGRRGPAPCAPSARGARRRRSCRPGGETVLTSRGARGAPAAGRGARKCNLLGFHKTGRRGLATFWAHILFPRGGRSKCFITPVKNTICDF